MAITSKFLRDIEAEARPIIERQMNDAKIIAGLRDVVAAAGGDWGALKALIKARVEDDNDEAGEGKRVRKIREKADCIVAYDDMLGSNMNEKNFSASRSYAEAKGRDAGSSSGRTAEFDSANAGSNPAPVTSGELTNTLEQPEEPATQSGLTGEVRTEAGGQSDAGTPDQFSSEYAGTSSDENPAPLSPSAAPPAVTVAEPQAPQAATVPHSVAPPPPGETDKAGETVVSIPASPANSFNNPRCQHPGTCSHAHDQGSCDDCFFDWAKRPLEEQRRLWAEAMEAASETEAA